MCGIFGLVLQNEKGKNKNYGKLEHDIKLLFLLSQVRGQDSAGIAILGGSEIQIFRRVNKPSFVLKDPIFKKTLRSAYFKWGKSQQNDNSLMIIGQCRLTTNGSFAIHENNQPVNVSHFVGVHNGIIINADRLRKNKSDSRGLKDSCSAESGLVESDTKLFLSRINELYLETGSFTESVSRAFLEIDGSASIGLLCDFERKLIVATNTGSLYYAKVSEAGDFIFASENKILDDFFKKNHLFNHLYNLNIEKVEAGCGMEIKNKVINKFIFHDHSGLNKNTGLSIKEKLTIIDIHSDVSTLKRCTRCILPHTYPFISFDEKGVCNFCRIYEKQKFRGEEELEKILSKYRSKDGKPDCLLGLSGGRDSCYGLHILKTKFGMHPVAYTYDWGLTTDVSRINQAKVCGKLGIEHIIRAPDIQKKRRHIRKNIYAWLERPKLGMVPLFMAGDKDFYHYGRQLRKELNIDLTVLCLGHSFEQREFFVGFCGVKENVTTTARLYHYSNFTKLKLALWYAFQYLLNPRYLNESFFDSIKSYFSSFVYKDNFLYLYEYVPWNEKEIELNLKKEYDWQNYVAYGPNQWRMGDGQTAFTNYIFYTIAGFTEFDNFRARQVREGLLNREEALKLVKLDNNPKYETLQYFSYLVGFNLDEVLAKINSLPKLY